MYKNKRKEREVTGEMIRKNYINKNVKRIK